MDENLFKQLGSLGFSDKEAACYLVCLEFGPVLASSISKQTGIKRSSIYDVLDALLAKGYISIVIKGGVKYFEVDEPSRIESELTERLKAAQSLVPELRALKTTHTGRRPVSRNLYGEMGSLDVLEDILKSKELWSYGNIEYFLSVIGRIRIKELLAQVESGSLNWFDLHHKNKDGERSYLLNLIKEKGIENYYHRVFKGEFSFVNATLIYNAHTVAFLSYDKDLSLVVVEDEQIFQTQKEVFRTIWASCA